MSHLWDYFNGYGVLYKTILRNTLGIKIDPEVCVLDQLIRPGFVSFDIGAAYGRFALPLSRLSGPTGRVFCFEPAEFSHKVLSNIIAFYRLKNMTLVRKALSNSEGTGKIGIPIKKARKIAPRLGHSLAHLVTKNDPNYVIHNISLTTMDQYVLEAEIGRLDFIKCDVEGAELLVFSGGEKTIGRYKPIILCEVYRKWLERFHATPDDVQRFFTERGYQIFVVRDQKIERTEQISEDGNYFLIHPSKNLNPGTSVL